MECNFPDERNAFVSDPGEGAVEVGHVSTEHLVLLLEVEETKEMTRVNKPSCCPILLSINISFYRVQKMAIFTQVFYEFCDIG